MKTGISTRNHFLDILKGYGMICVVFYHWSGANSFYHTLHMAFWLMMTIPIFMIISGYVFCLSFDKSNLSGIEEAYKPKNWLNKIIRFTLPFVIIFIIETVIYNILGERPEEFSNFLGLIRRFIRGGLGPGSYYFPFMIQFVFVIPIIYFLIKKLAFKGVIVCGILNLIYEILVFAYNMNDGFYRLIVLRYLLVIAVGCYFASKSYKHHIKIGIICLLLGGAFIFLTQYLYYKPTFCAFWTSTSMLACLYILPIMSFLLRKCKKFKFLPLEIVGKASYNIFLVQMIWYNLAAKRMYEYVSNGPLQVLLNFAACFGIGIAFYYIETPITKRFTKFIYRKLKLN